MVWETAAKNAGFTTGKPWLPIPEGQRAKAVDAQAGDAGSVLRHYRSMLGLRRAHPALATGSIRFLDAEGDVLAFVREGGGERLLCVFNFGDGPADWPLPKELGPAGAVDAAGGGAALRGGGLSLPELAWFVGKLG